MKTTTLLFVLMLATAELVGGAMPVLESNGGGGGGGGGGGTKRKKPFSPLGPNGEIEHCTTGEGLSRFYKRAELRYDFIDPELWMELDEQTSRLVVTLDVPYLPLDAHYVVRLGPHCASRVFGDDDPKNEQERFEGIELERTWGHAPNALYRDALANELQFGAYWINTTESVWRLDANGCARVTFSAAVPLPVLVMRCGADSDTLANDAVRFVGSYVQVELTEPARAAVGREPATWRMPFHLMLDEHSSSALLYKQVPPLDHAPMSAVLRAVAVDKRNKLSVHVQTQQAKNNARELMLASTEPLRADHASFALVADAPTVRGHAVDTVDMLMHDWSLGSAEPSQLYDGDFALRFCTTGECRAGYEDVSFALKLRLCNTNAGDEDGVFERLHSEVSQHLELAHDSVRHTSVGADQPDDKPFESGNRACMQTYVVGPSELTDKLELELIEARLCVDEDGVETERMVCDSAKHAVQLFPHSQQKANRDVRVTWPGAYGPLSVSVCFNVDALFRDDRHASLVRAHQRYESRVLIRDRAVRLPAHEFRRNTTPFDALRGVRGDSTGFAALVRSQSQQHSAFARYTLARQLAEARSAGQMVESHAHMFSVTARDGESLSSYRQSLQNLDEPQSAVTFVSVLLTMVCFIGVVVGACIVPRMRRQQSARSGDERRLRKAKQYI